MKLDDARDVLGVEAGASEAQLRSAYVGMLKRWHPDRIPAGSDAYDQAIRQTQRINAAYRVLGEEVRRSESPEGPTGVSGTTWAGEPIRTVDFRWWPLRAVTSDKTSIAVGVLVFLLAWAAIVGMAFLTTSIGWDL